MIYAYMRVSTPQQTIDNQHYALLKFADQHGLHVDTWISETSSGAKAYTLAFPTSEFGFYLCGFLVHPL
jgi:DNA invertase Pin-like site-specific DNA recombinase